MVLLFVSKVVDDVERAELLQPDASGVGLHSRSHPNWCGQAIRSELCAASDRAGLSKKQGQHVFRCAAAHSSQSELRGNRVTRGANLQPDLSNLPGLCDVEVAVL